MAGISSKALAFGGTENKLKYNGKEEQRNEFSDGCGLEWLEYGERMYDGQVGRWGVIDKLSETYSIISSYCFVANNPIKHFDIDGRKIGDPNDPDTKRIQESLLKTSEGTKQWNKLVNAKRTYYFGVVSKNCNEKWKKDFAKKMGRTMEGITLAKRSSDEFKKGNTAFDDESTLKYNTKTGKHEITKEWDNTYIIINEDNTKFFGAIKAAAANASDVEMSDYEEAEFAYSVGHESQHGLQTSFTFYETELDTKTKQYKKGVLIPYMDDDGNFIREHEKNADYKGKQIYDEYLKIFKKKNSARNLDNGTPNKTNEN